MSNTAQIEVLSEGGTWVFYGTCSKQSTFQIQQMMNGALKQTSWAKKARAIDAETKQLIDMAMK
jgi:hypothetical protein